MTTILPRARESVYELSDDLREDGNSSVLLAAAPSEAEREEVVLQKLGVKCWGRLHHFRHYYSQGWGEGAGKPLSPRALEAFYRFVAVARFPSDRKASLFLTDEGHLELCWENAHGKSVQVEFTPTSTEFFQEGRGLEGMIDHSALADLAQKLTG